MTIAISKEDREVLDDLLNSMLSFKQTLFQLSISLIIALKRLIVNFIVSLSDFSPKEIEQHGLEAILLKRAIRFFGLQDEDDQVGGRSTSSHKKPVTLKSVVKKVSNILLSPVYLMILICLAIRNKKRKNNVKNNYKT